MSAAIQPPPPLNSPRWRLLRLWARYDLPGLQTLFQRAGVWDDRCWRDAPILTTRARWHGSLLRLDLRDYHQRAVYFHGRMLDLAVQLAIRALLRPGDTFIDVGANIGLLSLLGAHAVGARGRVIAFEPAPDMHGRLRWHIDTNSLPQVLAHRLALSEREATLALTAPADNPGAATLGALPDRLSGGALPPTEVRARRADAVLGDLPAAPVLIKLDIEGHEPAALRGMTGTIASHRPAILTESNPEMLAANGSDVDELFALLLGLGYEPMALATAGSRPARKRCLHIHPMPTNWRPVRTQNVLFLPAGAGPHRHRIAALVRPLPAGSRPVLIGPAGRQ